MNGSRGGDRLHEAFKMLGIVGGVGKPGSVVAILKGKEKISVCITILIMYISLTYAHMPYILKENRKEMHASHG